LAGLGVCTAAHAEPPPRSLSGGYSGYELEVIREAERTFESQVDPEPEGKRIESVDWVGLDPIEPRDPAPAVLNVVHVKTQRWIIDGELTQHEGDAYRKVLADESARNLRTHKQFSLVVAVPLVGRSPRSVRWVIITKDVWSLLPDFDLNVSNRELQSFLFTPTETNFLGTHQTLLGRLELEPIYGRYGIGGGYRVPRLFRSRVDLTLDATVLFNDETGAPEGSHGRFTAVQPLVTQRSDWAWFSGVAWRSEITRPDHWGDPTREWSSRIGRAVFAVTRSFGWRNKHDLLFGLSGLHGLHLPLDPKLDPEAVRALGMPPSETQLAPVLEWHAYAGDYLRTYDLETLGLQEDFRLGHDLVARVAPTFVRSAELPPEWTSSERSSRDFFWGALLSAQETVALGDGFVRASFECASAFEPSVIWDLALTGHLRIASPRLGFGRLHFDTVVSERYRNYANAEQSVGGDGRLRGYPPNVQRGEDLIAMNLEYRTPSLNLFSIELGAVAFTDAASAFSGWDELPLLHSAGVGLRAVFPQIERAGFRLDLAFPLEHEERLLTAREVRNYAIQLAFGQAFPVYSVSGLGPPSD
jgi:hypothetical protein